MQRKWVGWDRGGLLGRGGIAAAVGGGFGPLVWWGVCERGGYFEVWTGLVGLGGGNDGGWEIDSEGGLGAMEEMTTGSQWLFA